MPTTEKLSRTKIAVALQGGGSHGAFSWGVLDRLLEEEDLDICGISGTSAGALNAVALLKGISKGGKEQARQCLKDLWTSIHELSKTVGPFVMNPLDKVSSGQSAKAALGHSLGAFFQQTFSPYELNPTNVNPFENFIRSFFDLKALARCKGPEIFLTATHVKTGKIKVFTNRDLSVEVLLAVTCLPFLYHAVRVDKEYYWDGGLIANPVIFPLIERTSARDIAVIQLTKTRCDALPRSQEEIAERFREITYNSCLMREMRSIHFITRMIDKGLVLEGELIRVNMFIIKNEAVFESLDFHSASQTDWPFLMHLFTEGRKTADAWLIENKAKIGKACAVNKDVFDEFV